MHTKPFLIMFLGYPGSGKSYFARQLADTIHAVRLNGDAMRIALFETVEAIEAHPNKVLLNNQTFGAIDYAVAQIIKAGHSIVYDAHHNKRSIRENLEAIAAKYNAIPITVWVKTPYDVALQRGQTRQAAADSRAMSEQQMRESIERHMANFDEPTDVEHVILIDGTVEFNEQYQEFEKQLAVIVKTYSL